jgi:TIR domain/KTSC domain
MTVMSGQNQTSRHLRVFLCHGSEDKPTVREIYMSLREDGVDPWLDERDILPGQDWNAEISQAVRQCDAILVCLSAMSVHKEGYLQKEIRFALDAADEKPEGTIFIIPVKLDECDLPQCLRYWQWVDWRDTDAYDRILRALRARADECGVNHLPGEGPLAHTLRPFDTLSGRALYRTGDVRELMRGYLDGKLLIEDVPSLASNQVVGITDEALGEALSRFQDDNRRAEEKEKLLALIGIRSPYREWLEATSKNHCYRNELSEVKAKREIERIPVRSSNLASVGYDPDSCVLEIAFHSGSVYRYFDVPECLFQGLLGASSHGRFFGCIHKESGICISANPMIPIRV